MNWSILKILSYMFVKIIFDKAIRIPLLLKPIVKAISLIKIKFSLAIFGLIAFSYQTNNNNIINRFDNVIVIKK